MSLPHRLLEFVDVSAHVADKLRLRVAPQHHAAVDAEFYRLHHPPGQAYLRHGSVCKVSVEREEPLPEARIRRALDPTLGHGVQMERARLVIVQRKRVEKVEEPCLDFISHAADHPGIEKRDFPLGRADDVARMNVPVKCADAEDEEPVQVKQIEQFIVGHLSF